MSPRIVRELTLNDVTIRGGDSVPDARVSVWDETGQKEVPFKWAGFQHNNDSTQFRGEFEYVILRCRPRSKDQEAKLKLLSDNEEKSTFKVTWNPSVDYEGFRRIFIKKKALA